MPAKSTSPAQKPKSKPAPKSKMASVQASPKPAAKRPAPARASKKESSVSRKKPEAAKPTAGPTKPASKQSQLIELLRSKAGATIDQMMKLTGWQPHTVRGTISGALRKRLGLTVQQTAAPDTGTRVYRIVESAA